MRRFVLVILVGCAFAASAAPASAAHHIPGHVEDCEPVNFALTWNPESWPPVEPSLWVRPECILP